MNSLIFLNTFEFSQNFLTNLENTVFEKKFEPITVKLLVESPGKFLRVLRKLDTKIY